MGLFNSVTKCFLCFLPQNETTFLTQHQPLPLLLQPAWRPKHLHPSTAESGKQKTSRIHLCFPHSETGVQTASPRLQKSLGMGCHGITRSLAGQRIISEKHLACSSGGKGSKSSDTSSSCSGKNFWALIFRNATLTRWMAELDHLQIQ